MQTVSVLGIHTFNIWPSSNIDGKVKLFKGRRWVMFANSNIAAGYAKLMFHRLYYGSYLSVPPGYGLVIDTRGMVVAYITVDGDVYSAIHESLESFNAADLGLCKTTITKYMRNRKLS